MINRVVLLPVFLYFCNVDNGSDVGDAVNNLPVADARNVGRLMLDMLAISVMSGVRLISVVLIMKVMSVMWDMLPLFCHY